MVHHPPSFPWSKPSRPSLTMTGPLRMDSLLDLLHSHQPSHAQHLHITNQETCYTHSLTPWLVSAAKRKLRSPPWQSLITHMSTYQPCIRNPPLMSALSTPTQRDESEAKEKVWKSSKWQKPRTIKRQSHLKWALSVPKDMGNYSTQLSSIASPQEEAERSQLH
jgi:hypothetical protein